MPPKRHTHKYILRDIGTKEKPRKVYCCALPDCTHFMPQKVLVIGKKSICWKCNTEFTIPKELVDTDRVKLKCTKCRKLFHKKGREEEVKELVSLDTAIDKLFDVMRK